MIMIEKEEEEKSQKVLGDKILGAHNNPTKDYEHIDSYEVDSNNIFTDQYYDEEEHNHRIKLEELIYSAFQESRWFPLNYKKKIPKDLVPHVFEEILEKLEETEFSFSEKFVSICDYIGVNYSKAYEIIPIKYKEMVINELETKFHILSKKKIKRLF
jgi:hypothetical protein